MKRDPLLKEYNNIKRSYENIFEANIKLVDENKALKEDLERYKEIIENLENQLKSIYELYCDNKDKEEIEKWIEEIKNE